MIESKVTVTADQHGRVVILSSNPDYAYIKLEQMHEEFDETGWLQLYKRTTLLKGKTERLEAFQWKAGMTLPGRIVIREQLQPFSDEHAEKELKVAGNTGIPCLFNDQPIYRRTFWDRTGAKMDDRIRHTNTDEIKAALLLKKLQVAAPNLSA